MKIAIKTLGCKSNRYESDKLLEQLSGAHEVFELNEGVNTFQRRSNEEFDLAIVNTCTVTHVADRKSRQAIRSMRNANPNCKIVVFGCGSNVSSEDYENMKEVDFVGDNIEEIIVYINDNDDKAEYKKTIDDGVRTRAVVKIQDGCNNYCSYCIIPFARGPEISFDKEKILVEIQKKEEAGFHEVVLTGIIISNWNRDGLDFVDLVEYLIEKTSSIRFRISSIEPQNFSKKFIRLFSHDRVCHHVHMSLQSGSDSVLERMRRKYDTDLYKKVAVRLKEAVPDIGLTTDVIVGFPGETDKEFQETCKFVQEIGFLKMHVFPYSKRKNTAAYHMKDQISDDIKKKRAKELRNISERLRNFAIESLLGNKYEIIIEECSENLYSGFTPNYLPVQFFCSDDLCIGQKCSVKLIEHLENGLVKSELLQS